MNYLHNMVKKKYVNYLVREGYNRKDAERIINDFDKRLEEDFMTNLEKLSKRFGDDDAINTT